MTKLVINTATGESEVLPFSPSDKIANDKIEAAYQAQLLNKPKEEAQSVLEAWDAKGFTRAWESAMAPIEAEDDVGEYDATVLAEKRAARAVVVG
jgi:hypothetical protein